MITFLQYLSEMKQSNLKKIGAQLNTFNKGEKTLHLDDIFGMRKRIAFPIKAADSRLTSFMDRLEDLGINLSVNDLKKGIITKKIQTQRGTQDRQLRLANYLNSLKKDADEHKKGRIDQLIQDWSVLKDRLGSMDTGGEYSVVVSRYPLDILRMSDHVDDDGGEIESCHSPDGGWFHCAIKEAHIGGAVAYAVKTSDLEKVDLQAKEIFKDRDRAVNGIVPIERVRLRRFHNERTKLEVLVPEIRTYPMKNYKDDKVGILKAAGFHEAVVEWAKKAQARTIAKINPEEDYKDFNLRGGAYQDNKTDVIWSDFFDVDVSGLGAKSSKDQSDNPNGGKQNAESLEHEAEQFIRHHAFRHVEVDFTGHDDGQGNAWGEWSARLNVELDGSKFIKMPGREINERPSYGYENNPTRAREQSLVMYMQDLHDDIQNIGVERADDQYVNLEIKLSDPHGNPRWGGEGHMHLFEHFLDRLELIDSAFNDVEKHLLFWFAHNGYIQNNVKETAHQYNFRHFGVEASAFKHAPNYTKYQGCACCCYEIHSHWAEIGDLGGITRAHTNAFNFRATNTFVNNMFTFKTGTPLPLQKFMHGRAIFMSMTKGTPMKIRLFASDPQPMLPEDKLLVRFEFVADYNEEPGLVKKTLAGVSVIDRDWLQYIEKMKQWWTTTKQQIISQG